MNPYTHFSDYIIAVGGKSPPNAETELFSVDNWSLEEAYPFGTDYFNHYLIFLGKKIFRIELLRQGNGVIIRSPIVGLQKTFYIFGGAIKENPFDDVDKPLKATKTIAAFSTVTKKWKKCGELNDARSGHGVFMHQGEFIVVGGRHYQGDPTDRCTLVKDTIICKVVDPVFKRHFAYPEMIRVPYDYCQE